MAGGERSCAASSKTVSGKRKKRNAVLFSALRRNKADLYGDEREFGKNYEAPPQNRAALKEPPGFVVVELYNSARTHFERNG
jgi:hypothetical protein